MKELRIAIVGHRFMGRAHSNAWNQVAKYFSVRISGTAVATGKPYTTLVEQTFYFNAAGKVENWVTTGDVSGVEAAFVK